MFVECPTVVFNIFFAHSRAFDFSEHVVLKNEALIQLSCIIIHGVTGSTHNHRTYGRWCNGHDGQRVGIARFQVQLVQSAKVLHTLQRGIKRTLGKLATIQCFFFLLEFFLNVQRVETVAYEFSAFVDGSIVEFSGAHAEYGLGGILEHWVHNRLGKLYM